MKRTAVFVLGCLGLAAAFLPPVAWAGGPPPGVAQPGTFNCYKAKDLKMPAFAGSTFNVTDEFGTQNGEVAKKPFLFCSKVGSPGSILSCYKVKGPGFAADSTRTVTDSFGTIKVDVKKKSFVFCDPGTSS
jgi:hypothetical protein